MTNTSKDEEVAPPSASKSPSSSKKKKRQQQRLQKKQQLKSKSVGYVQIDDAAKTSSNRKIKFTDDDLEELEQDTANVEDPPASVVQDGDNDDDDDDDDDDAIEEVTTSKARDELMLQRQQQRESAALSATKSKKKKKKKKALQKDDEDDDNDADFDEDFFAQVDSMRNEEAKKKEEAERAADFQRKGKHTTFVVNHEETLKDPEGKQVDSNMRVVVLDQHQIQTTASAVAAVPIGKLSEEALLFSRGRLVDGSDAASKKRGRDTYWCRTNTTIGVHSENPGHSQRGLVPINFANTKSAQQKRRKQVK